MEGKLVLFIALAVFLFVFAYVIITAFGTPPVDISCNEIAGISCPAGYRCVPEANSTDASGVCVSVIQPLKEKIYEFVPSLKPSAYICPEGEWVDCMPGPGPVKPQCNKDYLDWATQNCSGFRGAAY
jgi:hypothetical protein